MGLGINLAIRDMGPAVWVWDPDGANIELYPTYGSVNFQSEQIVKDIFEDGHGEAPVDTVDMGRPVKGMADFTRLTVAQQAIIVPGSVAGVSNLKVPNKAGNAQYANAKPLIIKPLSDGNVVSVLNTEWINVFKAYIYEIYDFAFDQETQRICHAEMKVFPDNTSGNVGELWRMGPA